MATKEIPAKMEYVCDKCKDTHIEIIRKGIVTPIPPNWYRLSIEGDYYRYPVADGTPIRLLCRKCGDEMRKVLIVFGLVV